MIAQGRKDEMPLDGKENILRIAAFRGLTFPKKPTRSSVVGANEVRVLSCQTLAKPSRENSLTLNGNGSSEITAPIQLILPK